MEKLRLMFQFLDGFVHDSKDWTPFEHISYQIPSPLGKWLLYSATFTFVILILLRHLVIIWKEYDYKIQKWFSQYDGKPYEHPIPWKRFQNASPLHPVMNDVVLFFEMHRYINQDVMRCPKCVMFEKQGRVTRKVYDHDWKYMIIAKNIRSSADTLI